MGNYDNYFYDKNFKKPESSEKSQKEEKNKSPIKIEKSRSAVYHQKDDIDLLNDDGNETKSNEKVTQVSQ